MKNKNLILIIVLTLIAACSKPCDSNTAMNKLLAFNKIQGRVLAKGGEGLEAYGLALGQETGPASELIAQQKYAEACKALDELAAKYKIDLDKEQEGMITIEDLAKDGGKGTGNCSIADAAQKQMELHGLLQAEVDAGRKTTAIFSTFNEDTKGYAEMLSTNPSKACELFETLKKKYGLK
jgi:hypothetical protein